MAVYYLGEGDLQTAFLHARKAIDMRPNTGFFWSNLGSILKRAGDLDHAEDSFRQAARYASDKEQSSLIEKKLLLLSSSNMQTPGRVEL